ncbi:MAG TPA: DoxX family protein [Stellaceae bacterium]|nr:DoxX family protein [Stellaceae bacterium]
MTTTSTDAGPRLLLPFLARFYDLAIPLSWPIIRVATGVDLAIHGWEKVVRLPPIVTSLIATGSAARLGPQFDPVHNIVLTIFEFVGGIAIALGLFTRFFAAAAAIEMAIITFGVFWPRGYHASEYTMWWGLILFAIALRGGGPYSLDRRLKREL